VPNPLEVDSFKASMPLSIVDIYYQVIHLEYNEIDQNLQQDVGHDHNNFPIWVVNPPNSHDFLDIEWPLDEVILEVMSMVNKTREDMHRQSFFILKTE
jgi:hypothetical protein